MRTNPRGGWEFHQEAMGTVFTLHLWADDRRYAEEGAAEAFRVLGSEDERLSQFVESSDVSRINRAAVGARVTVHPSTFGLLKHCLLLWSKTEGAFDVGARHGYRAGEVSGAGTVGEPGLMLDAASRGVTRLHPEVRVDLGGIGKGFGLDRMAELLCEWGLERGLLDGGSSSILAMEPPPGEDGWVVQMGGVSGVSWLLRRCALGISGNIGRLHVIDPRTGSYVGGGRGAWAIAEDAAMADGLSTAFMVLGEAGRRRVIQGEVGFCLKGGRFNG